MFETPPGRCNCHQTRQRAIMKRCGSITNRNADEGKGRVQGRGAGRGQGRQSSEEGGNWAPSSRSGASIDTDTLPFDASGRNRPEMGGGGGGGRRREEEGRGGMWGWAGERNHMEQDQLNPSLMAGRQANDPTSAGAGSIPAAILKSNGAPILQFPMELLKIQNWVEQTRRATEKAEREDHLSGSNLQLAILAEEEPVCSNGEGGGGGRRGRGGRGRWFHRSGTNAPSPQSTE